MLTQLLNKHIDIVHNNRILSTQAKVETTSILTSFYYAIKKQQENASCNNCRYLHEEVCVNDKSPMCADYPDTKLMCNKWREL